MNKFKMRKACEFDNHLLKNLFNETPQSDEVVINFERCPEFFDGTKIVTQTPDVWVYEDTSKCRFVGAFSIGTRDIYVNGKLSTVRYANDLRIHPEYRGGRSLINIFKKARELLSPDDWMQTIILAGNEGSLSTVRSGRAGLPVYYPFGEFETHLISASKKLQNKVTSLTIKKADKSDIPAMQLFFNQEAPKKQFYPHYEYSDILKKTPYYKGIKLEDYYLAFENEKLVGITSIWNQKCFKQTRFIQYKGKMRWLRPAYNLYANIMGGVVLPDAGNTLDFVYLHNTVIKDNRIDIFEALFNEIFNYCHNIGIKAIVAGFSVNDRLKTVLNQFRSRIMYSNQYLISFGEDPRTHIDSQQIPYVDVARL